MSLNFLLLGKTISIKGPQPVLENLSEYFSFFEQTNSESGKLFSMELIEGHFPQNFVGKKFKSAGPQYEWFEDGKHNIVRFVDESVAIVDKKIEKCILYSGSRPKLLLWSAKIIKTIVFDLLEEKGFHAIHALSFASDEKCTAIHLRAGHGKSSIAAELLSKHPEIEILSDEITYISEKGLATGLPIPLQLYSANGEKNARENPLHPLKPFSINPVRKKHNGIIVKKLSYFFTGWRPNIPKPKIEKISRLSLFNFLLDRFFLKSNECELLNPFLKWGNFGFFLRKIPILASRAMAAIAVLKIESNELQLCDNVSENTEFILKLVEKEN